MYDELKSKLPNISFEKGFDFEIPEGQNTLLIIDYQMHDSSKDSRIQNLFLQGVHY